jgi:hypothetical protein
MQSRMGSRVAALYAACQPYSDRNLSLVLTVADANGVAET